MKSRIDLRRNDDERRVWVEFAKAALEGRRAGEAGSDYMEDFESVASRAAHDAVYCGEDCARRKSPPARCEAHGAEK